jgi:uncharacterized protein (TIGR02466 family)
MNNDYQILELFPTPLLVNKIPENLSNVLSWFYEQPLLEKDIDTNNFGERSKNSYILNEPECIELSNYILNLTKKLGNVLGYDYETYKFSQSWISVKLPGQQHHYHTHPNSIISGVFYFGKSTQETPAIKFHKNLSVGSHTNSIHAKKINNLDDPNYVKDEFDVNFEPGLLILFPSYLHHSVPINKSNEPRYSMAFNIIPQEGFGNETELTELKF